MNESIAQSIYNANTNKNLKKKKLLASSFLIQKRIEKENRRPILFLSIFLLYNRL